MPETTDVHKAELNAALMMRSWGFLDAVATTGGADGGLNVRSHDALAQVKWRNGTTGRPEIQQLVGAADLMSVALFVIDASGGVTPMNGHARPYGVKWWALPFVGITRDDWVVLGMFAMALVGAAVRWGLYLGE